MGEQPNPPRAAAPNPVVTALGWLLAVLGGLWTLLTGLCTGLFFLVGLTQGAGDGAPLFALLLGALFITPGALMLWGGLTILRSQRKLRRGQPV